MLNSLRRKLVALTIVAAVFLLFAFHLTYTGKGLGVPNGMPSFIDGFLNAHHTTDASRNQTRTSAEYDTMCSSIEV